MSQALIPLVINTILVLSATRAGLGHISGYAKEARSDLLADLTHALKHQLGLSARQNGLA